MKKILITGGAGFIASNLIKLVLQKNSKVSIYSYDNYYSGSRKNHIKSKRVKYIKGDTQRINKNKLLNKIDFDHIFHFAEFSRIVPSFNNFDTCIKTNTYGTFEVIKFCLKKKAKLIYSASSSTIGKNKFLSPYSWSKYANNELVKNFSRWFGLKYVIVYFYNVYGPNQICRGKMATVIGIFEDYYLRNKPLPVVKPGSQSRRFTHIDDTIEVCFKAWKKNKNRHYSVTNKKSFTIYEVAKLFKTKIKYLPERKGERYASALSKINYSNKIYKFYGKTKLKTYIENFLQKHGKIK